MSKEEAGCELWDISADLEQAGQLLEHRALEVVTAVLQRQQRTAQASEQGEAGQLVKSHDSNGRVMEIAAGIAANLACVEQLHCSTRWRHGMQLLLSAACGWLLLGSDSGVLTEAFRFLRHCFHFQAVERWREAVAAADVVPLMAFVLRYNCHPPLLQTALEAAAEMCVAAQRSEGCLALREDVARACSEPACCLLLLRQQARRDEWDEPQAGGDGGADAAHITEEVMEAALALLQELVESTEAPPPQELVPALCGMLLDAEVSSGLRHRALQLLASAAPRSELSAEVLQRVLEAARASDAGDDEAEVHEAAWTILAQQAGRAQAFPFPGPASAAGDAAAESAMPPLQSLQALRSRTFSERSAALALLFCRRTASRLPAAATPLRAALQDWQAELQAALLPEGTGAEALEGQEPTLGPRRDGREDRC